MRERGRSGLGFVTFWEGNLHYAAHAGGFYGCSTEFWLELNNGLGVIILTNGEPYNDVSGRRAKVVFQMLRRLLRNAARTAAID